MDISSYLASVQPDAQGKVLARDVMQSGAIPDADNDPSTKDAAPSSYSSKWDDLPESENIDDRRDGNYDDTMTPENMVDMSGSEPGLNGVLGFAEGGDVPDEEQGVTEPVTTGAIPDPEQANYDQQEQSDQAYYDQEDQPQQGQGAAPEQGGYDRAVAMEAVGAGIDYGHTVHNLNKGIDDGTDNSQNARDHFTGARATPNDQAEAALNAADPEGKLGPGDKLLKAIGDVWKFYKEPVAGLADKLGETAGKAKDAMVGDISPEDRATAEGNIKRRQGAMDEFKKGLSDETTNPVAPIANKAAEAAHGLMSWARKAFNLAGTHATVADDRGNPAAAAKAGEVALNKNLDGLNVQVQAMNDGKYAVTIKNPETNKMILTELLTPEQYKHLFKDGYDKLIHRGVAPQVAIAAKTGEGQLTRIGNVPASQDSGASANQPSEYADEQTAQGWTDKNGILRAGNPEDHPEDVRTGKPTTYNPNPKPFHMDPEKNGLPKGMNIDGMSLGEISRLRREYARRQIAGNDAIASKERIVGQQEQGRDRRVQMQEEGRNKRNENLRLAPGQQEASKRYYTGLAAKAATEWEKTQTKGVTPEARRAKENEFRAGYSLPPLAQGETSGGETAGGNSGLPKPVVGQTVINGRTYMGGDPTKQESWR